MLYDNQDMDFITAQKRISYILNLSVFHYFIHFKLLVANLDQFDFLKISDDPYFKQWS